MCDQALMQKRERQMLPKLDPVGSQAVMTLKDALTFLRLADEMQKILKKAPINANEVSSSLRRFTDVDLSC
jgi:hypothetical protein